VDRQANGYEEVGEVRVLEEQAPEQILSTVTAGRLTYTNVTRLVAAGCGTRLSLELAPRLPWTACVVGARLGAIVASNNERIGSQLRRIKQLIEADPAASS
jgi:hypothetical protein